MSRVYEAMRRAGGDPVEAPSTAEVSLVSPPHQQEATPEPYRRLVQAVLWALAPEGRGVVLVTSSISGEGVSTVAENLARGLAASAVETLLVDANLRDPVQHESLGVPGRLGLGEVLSGEGKLEHSLQPTSTPFLSLLAAGGVLCDPARILEPVSLGRVVESLRARFDRIVLDSPPVGAHSEASSLARFADGAVLVIEAERTRSEVVHEALKALQRTGCPPIGAVLNRRNYHIPQFIYGRL